MISQSIIYKMYKAILIEDTVFQKVEVEHDLYTQLNTENRGANEWSGCGVVSHPLIISKPSVIQPHSGCISIESLFTTHKTNQFSVGTLLYSSKTYSVCIS